MNWNKFKFFFIYIFIYVLSIFSPTFGDILIWPKKSYAYAKDTKKNSQIIQETSRTMVQNARMKKNYSLTDEEIKGKEVWKFGPKKSVNKWKLMRKIKKF